MNIKNISCENMVDFHHLTNLRKLKISGELDWTSAYISHLIFLTSLTIDNVSQKININCMKNLTKLKIIYDSHIKTDDIAPLTKLTKLTIENSMIRSLRSLT